MVEISYDALLTLDFRRRYWGLTSLSRRSLLRLAEILVRTHVAASLSRGIAPPSGKSLHVSSWLFYKKALEVGTMVHPSRASRTTRSPPTRNMRGLCGDTGGLVWEPHPRHFSSPTNVLDFDFEVENSHPYLPGTKPRRGPSISEHEVSHVFVVVPRIVFVGIPLLMDAILEVVPNNIVRLAQGSRRCR